MLSSIRTIAALFIIVAAAGHPAESRTERQTSQTASAKQGQKQLFAVRGDVKKITSAEKGTLAITVMPLKDFAEVTVVARENDLVGTAVRREGGADLFGALAGDDSRDDEGLTAAELREGDLVSIIYDPLQRNRALEIYVH